MTASILSFVSEPSDLYRVRPNPFVFAYLKVWGRRARPASTDTSDTVFVELQAIRETVETAA